MIWPDAKVASMSWAALAKRSAVCRSWAKPAWRAAAISSSGEVEPPASTRQSATLSTSIPRRLSWDSTASASCRWTWRARVSGVRSRTTSPCTGWARVASKRRPSIAVSTSPLRSSRTRASEPTRPASTSTPNGSPKATSSRVATSSSSRPARRSPTRSWRRSEGEMAPTVRHRPASSTSVPASTPASTSSRRYCRLPSLASHSCCRAAPSTWPPNTCSSRSLVSARFSGPTSTRSQSPFFQTAWTASGAGSPVRTLATAKTVRADTSCWNNRADASSNHWASSTSSRKRCPPLRCMSASVACPSMAMPRSTARAAGGSKGARAPNGMPRADWLAMARSTWKPAAAPCSAISAASRVFPTPAGPARITPERSPRRRSCRA